MRKTKKEPSHTTKLIMIFLLTLLGVIVIGLLIILVCTALGMGSGVRAAEQAVFSFFTESIPEQQADAENITGKYDKELSDAEYMKNNRIYRLDTSVENEITLCFAGDILFDDEYAVMANAIQRGNGVLGAISPEVIERMQAADLMMLNNEFAYTNGGIPTAGKQYTFRADPATVTYLEDMGVDIVSLANNHAYDYGEQGLLDTLQTLEENNIPYVGAGRNLEEACAPVYYIAGNMKIAFVSATQIERLDNPDTKGATDVTPGVFRCFNPDKLYEVVAEAKANSDFVIVYVHWGTENTDQPDWLQEDQAPEIARAGADLIIGDHAHCLQGFTYFDNTPVIYSLGNFWFNSKTVDTCLLEVKIGGEGIRSIQFIPALQSDCKTTLLSDTEKERVLNYMRNLSPGVMIDAEGYVSN